MFKKSSRVLLVTLLLFVLAGSTYAFAAENTVEATYAGDGEGGISGYKVTNIVYTTENGDITGVSFSLDVSATTVQAAVGDATPVTTTLVDCDGGGTSWACDFSGSPVSVFDAAGLRVVAVQ